MRTEFLLGFRKLTSLAIVGRGGASHDLNIFGSILDCLSKKVLAVFRFLPLVGCIGHPS